MPGDDEDFIVATITASVRVVRRFLSLCLIAAIAGLGAWYAAPAIEDGSAVRVRSASPSGTAQAVPVTEFAPGEVVGGIIIPRVGLDSAVVEMADVDDIENLDRGPAHIRGTALPGREGNCVIAGHRATHGRPFYGLDSLAPPDEIVLVDSAGLRVRYAVTGVLITGPDDVSVLAPTPEPTVTLISCHPVFSTRQRLVVQGAATE
ncbi:MAG: class E sortase [Actinobacteria bacterium]|nr:class E sortase [Actinomycetota bacterium]MBU1943057.1 class E sortase [Actinomycetota bacterium]MBU2687996.1 class E sortase [Actinomycetota bacterium]